MHLDVWGPYKVISREGFKYFLTIVDDYSRLPSSVLNEKSPFSLVYNKEPNLSHLRSFSCLCYAALIKGSDKFSEKSKKCVLIGYASDKKAYKLFSLENKNVLYSRDVKFYETIFPYKMSVQLDVEQDETNPNDDEEGSSCRDGRVYQSGPSHSLDQPKVNEQIPTLGFGSDLQGSGNDGLVTATPIDENTSSEGNVGFNDQEIYQMDINNAFLYGDLIKEVYMLPHPGFFDPSDKRVCKLKKSLYRLKQAPRPVLTPLPENIILAHKETEKDKFLVNVTSYQRLVGKLIYLTLTRHDISYAVHCLSQHMHAPLKSHFDIALRLLKYLKLAPSFGVQFVKRQSGFDIKAFLDSDWAKCPVTRRSVSGYCVFVNGCLISWKSKKQVTLSKSSAEAEYRSMAASTCEIMRIVKIMSDLNIKNLFPGELYCDNKAAMQIDANPVMHEKTKHFDLDVHFIREKVCSGLIKTVKVESKDNVVDVLTKALGSFQHGLLTKKFVDVALSQLNPESLSDEPYLRQFLFKPKLQLHRRIAWTKEELITKAPNLPPHHVKRPLKHSSLSYLDAGSKAKETNHRATKNLKTGYPATLLSLQEYHGPWSKKTENRRWDIDLTPKSQFRHVIE
uniref:Ribonuclease H-like domain-containing protein n=1 Tax=Tanacetum cinerariifolium TaxID=118510 RepID=A0A6L2N1V5_TANCI|nr:ribonuclease H-like domain-containing protein [Tanacetum cinerariifolium]